MLFFKGNILNFHKIKLTYFVLHNNITIITLNSIFLLLCTNILIINERGNFMAIEGIIQPELIQVDDNIRLRKYDRKYDFAYDWYQDEETVYLVDGKKEPYSNEMLSRMYEYLNNHGELYFIEIKEGDVYFPIGDVTFSKIDMPIVIGDKKFRGKGIGEKVIRTLIQRGQELGYSKLFVNEIYSYNPASRKCFEKNGFVDYEETDKGNRFQLSLI